MTNKISNLSFFEDTSKLLGHPNIEVELKSRGINCANCGQKNHTSKECPFPKMEQLLESFGDMCYSTSPVDVEKKIQTLKELYEKKG